MDNIEYDEGSGLFDSDGDIFWRLNKKIHRVGGPAVIWRDGAKWW